MRDDQNKPKKKLPTKMGSKLSPPEKAHIEEVIESAMRDYISSQTKFIKNREELVNRVTGIVSEYLSPFILIGYDTKGQPINIVQASSQLDADALSTAVNKLIFNND